MAADGLSERFIGELNGWAGRVLRIVDELDAKVVTDSSWTCYDFVGACHNRDRVESAVLNHSPILEAVDRLFLLATVEVGNEWVAGGGLEEETGAGWWWSRIPLSGPVRQDIDRRWRPQ